MRLLPRFVTPRRLAALAGLLVLGTGVLVLGRGRLVYPWLAARLEAALSRELDAEVRIGALGDAGWLRFEASGLEIRRGRGPLRALEGGRLSVELRAALGPDALVAAALSADSLVLALPDEPRATPEEPPPPPAWPATWPGLDLTVGRLEVRLGARTLGLDGVRLAQAGGAVELGADRWRLTSEADGTLLAHGRLAARGRLAGGRLTLETLDLAPELALASLVLDLDRPGGLAVEADLRLAGGGGRVTVDPRTASLHLEGVELERLGDLLPPLAAGTPRGSLGLDLASEDGRGRFTLRWSTPGLDALRLDALEAAGSWSPERLELDRLEARAGPNRLEARSLTLPLGAPAEGPLAATLLARAAGEITVRVEDLPRLLGPGPLRSAAEELRPHRLELSGRLADGTLHLSGGRLETPGGHARLTRGTLALAAPSSPWRDTRLELDLDLDFPDLARALALFDVAAAGRLEGSAHLAGSLSDVAGSVRLAGEDLVLLGRPLGTLSLAARASSGVVTVTQAELIGPAGRIQASGRADLARASLAGVRLRVSDLSPEALAPDLGATGSLTAEIEVSGPWSALRGEASARGSLRLGEAPLDLRLGKARLGPDGLGLDGLVVTSPHGEVTADLHLEEPFAAPGTGSRRLHVLALEAVRGAARLSLERPVVLTFGGGDLALEPFALCGDLGRLGGRLEPGSFLCELDDLDPMPLLGALCPPGWGAGAVSGTVRLAWDETPAGSLPAATVRLEVGDLRLGPDAPAGRLSLDATLGERDGAARLVLGDLTWEARGARAALAGELPWDARRPWPLPAGPLELVLTADLSDPAPWRDVLGSLSAPVQGADGAQDPAGTLGLRAGIEGTTAAPRGRVHLTGTGLGLARLGLSDLDLDLALNLVGGASELALSAALPDGSLELRGELGLAPDATRGDGGLAGWPEAPLTGRGAVSLGDLSPLAAALPGVRSLAGKLEGSASVSGRLGDPVPEAALRIDVAELRLEGSATRVRDLAGEFVLSGDRLGLTQGRVEVAGAALTFAGDLDLGEGGTLDLRLAGEDVLLHRSPGVRLRGDVDLRLAGSLAAPTLGGEIRLRDSRYARDVRFLGNLFDRGPRPTATRRGLELSFSRTPPLSNLRFDVGLSSAEPLVVATNVLRAGLRPELRLRGTGEVPYFEGDVYLDRPSLSLPSGTLTLDQALVRFPEETPFLPEIEGTGGMRVKGYDLRVRLAGPYDAPEIELSSNPPLPSDELLVLALTGELPVGSAGDRGLGAARSVGVYLAKDFVSRWLAGGDDDEARGSLLERLEFEVGADLTPSGAPTAEVTYFLSPKPRDTGRVPYLSAERDRFDEVNFGLGLLFRFR